ncbi:MAG TPA: DUF2905 domain-containing protein [Anaerolineales bacterium]|jgi:hypothetical protein
MNDIGFLGKLIILAGGVLVLLGALVWLLSGTGLIGRLPGDIRIERPGFTCIFPLASMILLSIFLTIVLNVILRMMKK